MPFSTAIDRNHGLDFLKGIMACLIVFVHVPFPRPIGLFVAYLGTVSVSVFFMVSGYFSSDASSQKLRRSIRRTLLYLLVAEVLYLFKMLIESGFDWQQMSRFLLNEVLAPDHLLKLLIISQSKVCFVAWFLISLLVCYVLRLLLGKHLRILGLVGLVAGIVVSLPPIDTHMDFPMSNPWMWGIPFFTLGELIHGHENSIINLLGRHALAGCCLVAPALFLLFAHRSMKENRFCLLGSTYVFFVYIMHPLVSACYHAVRTDIGVVESWLRPLIVLAATVLLAAIYYHVKSQIAPLTLSRDNNSKI